jgi:hypothetical protein
MAWSLIWNTLRLLHANVLFILTMLLRLNGWLIPKLVHFKMLTHPLNDISVFTYRLRILNDIVFIWGSHSLYILESTWNKRIIFNMLWNNDIFLTYFKYIFKMNYKQPIYIYINFNFYFLKISCTLYFLACHL